MAGTLTPTPFQTVLDATGVAVSGAKIYTYTAGTTTAAATYTTLDLSVENANPIVADSSGRYVAYLPAGGNFKFTFKTSGDVLIKEQDNVQSVPGSSVNLDVTETVGEAVTAGQVVYLSSGSESSPLTAGLWYLTDSDATATSTLPQSIGMAVSAIAINTEGTIRLAGKATTGGSVVVGSTYYISATPGGITTSAPANSRVVGVAQTTSSLILAATSAVVATIPSPITQDLLFTDDTYDIGKSGATRPRDLFQSRNAAIGGTLAVTGTTALTGALTLTGGLNTPLVVAQGGTGLATLTSANVLIGAGTGTPTFVAPSTSGNVLTSNGSAWTSAATSTPESDLAICEGRLTLTSGTAVTTADVTGATSIFFTPYKGSRIALYDGSSAWNIRTFTEITIALGTLTDAKPYDLFAYDDSGTVTFDSPLVWTNDTTRATALTLQNGVLVKTGATTRRYIGTFYTTATTTTEDSLTKRLLYNYMNRVSRSLYRLDTGSHTYTLGTWRQFDADTANQLEILQGWSEDVTFVEVGCHGRNSTAGAFGAVSLGLDSTTSPQTNATIPQPQVDISNYILWMTGVLRVNVGVGWHKVVWLERSQASGTYTYFPDAGGGVERGGMTGVCWA
jgi:hypothetical protein